MVKIKDVAQEAGVSTATVSRILSNPEWGKPETRKRVMDAVKKLQYRPNALARQLRTQETKTIIVIVPNLENYIYHEILYGIEAEAELNGYQVLIADTHGQSSIESYYLNAIQQREVDGIISMSANAAQRLTQQIAGEYPLVVALQSTRNSKIPSVGIDNIAAARALMKHLVRMGHRSIAHITSDADIMLYHDRKQGYLSILEENSIPIDPDLIRAGDATLQGGYEQMNSLLDSGKKITAVFAAGDTMALGAIYALKKRGLRVPEDCAVVGFDDIEFSAFYEPTLTTIRQPKRLIGQYAFRKLFAIMKKEPVPETTDLLPFELIIRESCGYFL